MEQFIDKAMRQSTLEKVSVDFTSLVMEKVANVELKSYTTYEPLISKRTWFALSVAFIGIMMYAIWAGISKDSGVLETINFNFINAPKISEIFKGLQMSSITRNSILIFSVLFFIQIPILNEYFNKQIMN